VAWDLWKKKMQQQQGQLEVGLELVGATLLSQDRAAAAVHAAQPAAADHREASAETAETLSGRGRSECCCVGLGHLGQGL
jgi:hypothetical protein